MDEIRALLNKEIKNELQKLNYLEDGTDEKRKAVENAVKLYELRIGEYKAETERIEKQAHIDLEEKKREDELTNNEVQRKGINLDRWISLGLQVGIPMVTLFAYDIWHRRGLKFEETGTITSPWTRNLMSKMTPKN